MAKKARVVSMAIVGVLFLATGVRDLFAPGFLVMSRYYNPSKLDSVLFLALGLAFLFASWRQSRRGKRAEAH